MTKVTSSPEWQELVKDLEGVHATRMNKLLKEMSNKDFRIAYVKLLDYTQPQLQRQEIMTRNEGANILEVHVINHISEIPKEKVLDIDAEELE